MQKQILFFFIIFSSISTYTQSDKKGILNIKKVGFLYNNGSNENFIFNDPDYSYTTNTYKLQAFYELARWKKVDFELIVQPQIQTIQHQLLNKWFVTPDQDNVQEKINEFTQQKTIHLYSLEFGFASKVKLTKKLDLQSTISLGFSYINKRSERLAEGFTFIENFSFGLSYEFIENSYLYLGSNFGHVSNLNFQKPNDGYNILGLEVGYSIKI